MRKNILVFVGIAFALFSNVQISNAQAPNFSWVKTFQGIESSSFILSFDIKGNSDGDLFVAGVCAGKINFEQGTIQFISDPAFQGMFVLKMNQFGNIQWVKYTQAQDCSPYALDLDNDGNIIISGSFVGTVDFDPSSNVSIYTSSGIADAFVLKMSDEGDFVWVKVISGNSMEYAYSVDCDASNNIIVGGVFSGLVDFNPSPTETNVLSATDELGFVLKLNSAGNYQWAIKLNALKSVVNKVVADNSGSIYVDAGFEGYINVNPDIENVHFNSKGLRDIYLLKLNLTGQLLWSKQIGYSADDQAYGMNVDVNNEVILGGFYNDTLGGQKPYTFYQKYNSTGDLLWEKLLKGNEPNDYLVYTNSLSSDLNGNIYSCGLFFNTLAFEINQNADSLNSNGSRDAFILSMNSNGEYLWVKQIGGLQVEEAQSIFVDENSNVFTLGTFSSSLDFDTDTSVYNVLIEENSSNLFIHKMGNCSMQFNNINVETCNSYFFAGKTFVNSGNFIESLPNSQTCDSNIRLNLILNSVDTSVIVNNNILTSNAINSQYQWVNCNMGFEEIDGETNSVFIPQENGLYALIVTTDNCIDTSRCYEISTIGIDDMLRYRIKISPNPTADKIEIFIPNFDMTQDVAISIENSLGEQIKNFKISNRNTSISLIDFPKGVYFVSLKTKLETKFFKIVKM